MIKNTKIISTIGPSISQKIWDFNILNSENGKEMYKKAKDILTNVIKSGVNTIRLNFSHGGYEEQEVRINLAREVSKETNIPVSILLDTKGPEIRVAKMRNGECEIAANSIVKIECLKNVEGDSTSFSVTDSTGTYNMAKDVKVGSKILVDDGKLFLIVKEVNVDTGVIVCEAKNRHIIKEKKRINLPGAKYSMNFLSEKDINDIKFAIEKKCDYIAASFVGNANHVHQIKQLTAGSNIKIIAKIESTEGLENLDAIIKIADGIMVARGDLGIEIPYFEVPYYQNMMIEKCYAKRKPCIVATQMIDSMERNLLPTRAEVTDVWYAVNKGCDSTMTSGETAQGLFPVEAIKVMSNIISCSEKTYDYKFSLLKMLNKIVRQLMIVNNVSKKKTLGMKKQYDFNLVFNDKDENIISVSHARLPNHTVFVTNKKELSTKYGIYYGVTVYYVADLKAAANDQSFAKKVAFDLFGDENLSYYIIKDKKLA